MSLPRGRAQADLCPLRCFLSRCVISILVALVHCTEDYTYGGSALLGNSAADNQNRLCRQPQGGEGGSSSVPEGGPACSVGATWCEAHVPV